jgi:3',5'-cyclic AMP phosphodiesterase CpdA
MMALTLPVPQAAAILLPILCLIDVLGIRLYWRDFDRRIMMTLLPGAVLTRVASSHIRVGTFEFFGSRGDGEALRLLADHVIARHYPAAAAEPSPYRALLGQGVPFHAVLGNHDLRTANGNPQVAYPPFGMGGRWYTLRRGAVQFFMLDTNVNAPWQHQGPWLRRVLAASTAPWKVVVGHHPIYSSGFYGNDPVALARLGPLFRRHGVQLYINGHDHHYERSRPLDGTTYLVVGGGGASLRPVLLNATSASAVSAYSFAELQFTADHLQLNAWRADGRPLDQALLKRS